LSRKIIIANIILIVILTIGVVGCGKITKVNESSNSEISRIAILPEEIILAPNGFQQFKAILYDSGNNVVTNESTIVSWSVSGNIGTIAQNGTFTAAIVGDGQAVASVGNIQGTANVKVIDGAPPSDFQLTEVGEKLFPSRTISISWTIPEATAGSLVKYDVYSRMVEEGMNENDERLWVYLKKDISPSTNSTEIPLPYDGIYDIKVRVVDSKDLWRDSDGGSSSGDPRDPSRILRAEIDATPPLFFSMIYPGYGRSLDAKDVRIAWNETQDENLDYYEVIVGADPNNMHGSAIFSATFEATASRECWVRNLERGVYYIYLAAYDKAGHYRRIDGKTDIPEFDLERINKWPAAWPSFEIDPIPPGP